MAHYAEIVQGIVARVVVVNNAMLMNDGIEDEALGAEFLNQLYGGDWVQTSFNTYGGVHYIDNVPSDDQTKALRFNFAGPGFTYDENRDAFIMPKPHDSWVLNETSCFWEAPVPYPDGEELYLWDEPTQSWLPPDAK